MTPAFLQTFSDVEATPLGYVATSAAPKLRLDIPAGIPTGQWIRLVYRTSYLDHLVRPLILFETNEGTEWDVMSAGLFGKADWIGRIPDGTRRILISPVDRMGRFGFEIESCEIVSRLSLLPRALRKDPKTTAMAIGARLIQARQETRQALRFARGGIGMELYAQWRAERIRPFDPQGLDAPRAASTPHICFLVRGDHDQRVLHQTPLVESLLAQSHQNWSLRHVGEPLDGALDQLAPDDLIICADASDRVAPYALPVVAEMAAAYAEAQCFYGDEDACDASGAPIAPRLKPDWSRRFEAGQTYLGKAVFWRARCLRAHPDVSCAIEEPDWRRLALQACKDHEVWHIRRILMTVAEPAVSPQRDGARAAPRGETPVPVSIIIPNRDQLALVKECVAGVLQNTDYPALELVIVDHESAQPTLDYYKTLADDPRVRILSATGPFNFSAMCNAGAAAASGACLVFLNNDMAILNPDWLHPLVEHAMEADVGAVGARLLFPSGKIQHAGVTVGMGGYADHTSHGVLANDPGYLKRLRSMHEVSAVTGACIAVEARKFHAVSGFDAEHLPVELNDIDLCLKLGAMKWRSLMCPEAVLIHHQSASRGFSYRPFTRYAGERKHFRRTWPDVIRDDPYFHPALSLFSISPELDG